MDEEIKMTQPESPPMHPITAVQEIQKELSIIANFINSARIVHGLNISDVRDSFQKCDSLLASLMKYEQTQYEQFQKDQALAKIKEPNRKQRREQAKENGTLKAKVVENEIGQP